jgi:2-C-methyl-D-erythritol 4-phosphate cytidylyltransferase
MAVALIVAAGRGERLGLGRPKALVTLGGKPMLSWSVETLHSVPGVEQIVVALPSDALDAAPAGVTAVTGGRLRSESVRAALYASVGDPVVVHDAARPLASSALFERILTELERTGADAVIAASPVSDTIKETRGPVVARTIDRSRLWAIQTPQVFRRAALERALEDDHLLEQATDDAWLVEQQGGVVHVLAAGEPNFKITTATDLRLAELLLKERTS